MYGATQSNSEAKARVVSRRWSGNRNGRPFCVMRMPSSFSARLQSAKNSRVCSTARRADRLGGIDDDGVEALVRLGDELAAVRDDDDRALVVEGIAGDLGVVLQRGVDHGAIDLAQHRLLDGRMLQHLAQTPPSPPPTTSTRLGLSSAISGTCAIISW